MHTYSLPQPRNAPAALLKGLKKGPWLFLACRWLGIDESLWLDVARLILGDLALTLKELEHELPNFHVIDTLALTTGIKPSEAGATGDSNDWDNEIHPNREGYRMLAETWAGRIAEVIPG